MKPNPSPGVASVILHNRCLVREAPRSDSPECATLFAGRYAADRWNRGAPGAADYVHIPEQGWVCLGEPGEVPTATLDRGHDALVHYVPESSLIRVLRDFQSYTYPPMRDGKREPTRYPWPLGALKVNTDGPAYADCTSFLAGLLIKGWLEAHPTYGWSLADYNDLVLATIKVSEDYFRNVALLARRGLAVRLFDDAFPPRWTYVQAWRRSKKDGEARTRFLSGHAFLVLESDPTTDRVLTLESNYSFGLTGIGFRTLGNLRDFDEMHPGRNWSESVGPAATWSAICETYPYRRQAMLRVAPAAWIENGPVRPVMERAAFEALHSPDDGHGLELESSVPLPPSWP